MLAVTRVLWFSLEIRLDINNLCKVLVLVVYDIYQSLVLTEPIVNNSGFHRLIFMWKEILISGKTIWQYLGLKSVIYIYLPQFARKTERLWRSTPAESRYLSLVAGRMNIDPIAFNIVLNYSLWSLNFIKAQVPKTSSIEYYNKIPKIGISGILATF